MPTSISLTRSTYTVADAITPAMFNAQSAISGTVADATAGTEGVVRLAGDLTGTAEAPALANTSVTAGTYGNTGTNAAQITVDAKGRITAASNRAIPVPGNATTSDVGLIRLANDFTGTGLDPNLTLTGVLAGTYAATSLNVAQFSVDAKGRISNAGNRDLATLILNHVREALYPVGEILITHRTGNPSTWLNFGTWVAYAAGKVLLGLDTADITCDTIDETGGAKTHTIQSNNMLAHNHSIPGLSGTAATAGSHRHALRVDNGATEGTLASGLQRYNQDMGVSVTRSLPLEFKTAGRSGTNLVDLAGDHTHTVSTDASTTGVSGLLEPSPINHMNPFIVVAMWRRTA